jgi:hypothetical protein
VPKIEMAAKAAVRDFDAALPALRTMRDVGEHFDDYALEEGRQKASLSTRPSGR